MEQILCFGDSNTYGYRFTDRGRFDAHTRWTGRLAEKLTPFGFGVIESGLNGRTTMFDETDKDGRNGLQALPEILRENAPVRYAIVMLGTNDCKTQFHASPQDITDGMDRILQCFEEHTRMLLVCPALIDKAVLTHGFSQSFDEDSIPKSAALEPQFAQLAAKHRCLFLSAVHLVSTAQTDGIHLDETGHAVLAQALFQCIRQHWLSHTAPAPHTMECKANMPKNSGNAVQKQ